MGVHGSLRRPQQVVAGRQRRSGTMKHAVDSTPLLAGSETGSAKLGAAASGMQESGVCLQTCAAHGIPGCGAEFTSWLGFAECKLQDKCFLAGGAAQSSQGYRKVSLIITANCLPAAADQYGPALHAILWCSWSAVLSTLLLLCHLRMQAKFMFQAGTSLLLVLGAGSKEADDSMHPVLHIHGHRDCRRLHCQEVITCHANLSAAARLVILEESKVQSRMMCSPRLSMEARTFRQAPLLIMLLGSPLCSRRITGLACGLYVC